MSEMKNNRYQDANVENSLKGPKIAGIDTTTNSCLSSPDSMWRHNEFFRHLKTIFDSCHEMIQAKNLDYTRISSDDPFHNFNDNEISIALRKNHFPVDSVVMNILNRLGEKRKRLVNIIITGEQNVLSESLEDTLQDSINYHAILLAYLKMNGRLEYKEDLKSVNKLLIEENSYLNDKLTQKDLRIKEFLEIENDHLKKKVSSATKASTRKDRKKV